MNPDTLRRTLRISQRFLGRASSFCYIMILLHLLLTAPKFPTFVEFPSYTTMRCLYFDLSKVQTPKRNYIKALQLEALPRKRCKIRRVQRRYLEIRFSYNIKRWLPQFSDAGEECWRRMQYLEMFPRKMHFPHLLATLLKHSVIFFKVVKSSKDEMTLILGALTKCAVIWGLIKRNPQIEYISIYTSRCLHQFQTFSVCKD